MPQFSTVTHFYSLATLFTAIFLSTEFVYSSEMNSRSSASALACEEIFSEQITQLIRFDPRTEQFQGLTPEGLEALRQARDILRERDQLFNNEFKNLKTVHHGLIVTRLAELNMFLYGPPGAAKTAVVNWLMKGEKERSFKLQLHQMMTEQAFVGGQNYEAARQGRFEINTEGSLIHHVLGLIDEIDKGNPAALASLLSLMNERAYLIGNDVIKARLQALFATSNAFLPEIFQSFVEGGQGSTALALFNRLHIKALLFNWLDIADQAALDQRRQRTRYLKALALTNPEVMKNEVFLEPKPVDWDAIRQIAVTLFDGSPLFMAVFREFTNDIRVLTNREIKESESRHKTNHLDEPFIYIPSADYSERLRGQIVEVILMSAFVDFLLSPLADDGSLEHLTQKQILLDPLSLWRGMFAQTTLGPGQAKLIFDPSDHEKVDIDFGWNMDPSTARDSREELLIRNLQSEQERFRTKFLGHMQSLQEQIQLGARNAVRSNDPNFGVPDFDNVSFELLMLQFRGK